MEEYRMLQSLQEIEGENSLTDTLQTTHKQDSPSVPDSALSKKDKPSEGAGTTSSSKTHDSIKGITTAICEPAKQGKFAFKSPPTQDAISDVKEKPGGKTPLLSIETALPKTPQRQGEVEKEREKGRAAWENDLKTKSGLVDLGKFVKTPQTVEARVEVRSGGGSCKAKAPAPPVMDTGVLQMKSKEEKRSVHSGSIRTLRDEHSHLEVLEESPASPSPSTPSPSTSKSRTVSPGDRSSFVTQLTSVAKTVLGPMKLGSQDGGKGKDPNTKTSEDKRAGTLGKSEASSGAWRIATGTWPGPGSSKSKSSNKHS